MNSVYRKLRSTKIKDHRWWSPIRHNFCSAASSDPHQRRSDAFHHVVMTSPLFLRERYGPRAVVTGASSGIGAAFASHLAAAGLNVVLTARRSDRLVILADSLSKEHSVQVKSVTADLTTEFGWRVIVSACARLEVGLVVNNAGFEVHGSFFRHTSSVHCDLVRVNVSAVVALSHAFGRAMVEHGRGGLLFVSSVTHRPHAWYASYSASKAFVSSFAAVLRAELKGKGVDVLALEPGGVESEMMVRMRETINLEHISVPVISSEWCATEGIKALARGRGRWTPGFHSNRDVDAQLRAGHGLCQD